MAKIKIIGRNCTQFAVVYSHNESKYPTIETLVGNSEADNAPCYASGGLVMSR